MQSPPARILLQLTGGLIVVVASFFATTAIFWHWSSGADADGRPIHIVEATYGKDCQQIQPGNATPVKDGNATAAVKAACRSEAASCLFVVDVIKLGDPANGCGKDFQVSWRCGVQPRLRQFYLPAEADRATALISCQSW